ncbi:MAG: hypothetical protein QMD36_05685 [Candidatus Aenigmarchaeota archaeon]|nr:hypothetical protein [Candidatus Aenigmarchaeota archaeon]
MENVVKTLNDRLSIAPSDLKSREVPILTQKIIKRITGVSPYGLKKVHKLFLSSPKEVREKFNKL